MEFGEQNVDKRDAVQLKFGVREDLAGDSTDWFCDFGIPASLITELSNDNFGEMDQLEDKTCWSLCDGHIGWRVGDKLSDVDLEIGYRDSFQENLFDLSELYLC